jgi:xylulokinase
MEPSGAIVATASAEHQPFASPQPGWAEQDPHDWWAACCTAVRQVTKQAGINSGEIACVGFSGQMHGAVLLDGADQVIRPAIIWCDQRTEDQVHELMESIGVDRLIRATCNPPLTNFTLTKLLWVRENEPQHWKRFRHLLLPKDYVRFRLTNERAMDMADASGTLLLDVANRRWSSEIVSDTGLDRSILPTLCESSDICGRVSPEGADETGLQVGTPVVAGAGDQAAGAVGMGVAQPGAVSATIGTSGVVFAATERPAVDLRGRIHTFCHAIPGRWHVMGVTQAAGLSLQWFANEFAKDLPRDSSRYRDLSLEASAVAPGAEGLYWLPYLMGERTPHCDPNARGALLGMTASHTRGHIVRAILEGVAFSLKDSFSIFEQLELPVECIRLGGGGARSPLWRQIQADVYQREVEIVEAEEGAAYGAAILAGVGAKIWSSVDEACDAVVHVAHRIAPNPGASEILQKNYLVYRRIYPALRELFDKPVSARTSSVHLPV